MCSLCSRHPGTRHWHLYDTETEARCLEKTDRQLVCAQLVVVRNPSLPGLKTSRSSQALTSWHCVYSAKAQWWHEAFQGCGEMQTIPSFSLHWGSCWVGGSSWSLWAAAVLEELGVRCIFPYDESAPLASWWDKPCFQGKGEWSRRIGIGAESCVRKFAKNSFTVLAQNLLLLLLLQKPAVW